MSSDEIQEQQEAAAEQDALLTGLNNAAQPDQPGENQNKVQMLSQLTESDLVASDDALQNLTSKDIPSANFSDAEAHEMRHYLDVVAERKRAAKPHDNQRLTGVLQEWAHDDKMAAQESTDRQDLLKDDTFRQGIAARITKGKDGSLLGLALRSINESVLRKGDSDDGGLIGKLR
jgi:hypothetical protein